MRITDKMRLNYLGKRGNGPYDFCPQMGVGGVWVWSGLGIGRDTHPRGQWFKSLRQAIDAAIRAERRGKK